MTDVLAQRQTAISPLRGKAALTLRLCTARTMVWEGAVRSGKTVASIIAWLEFILDGPPGDLLMVGKTERTLKRNIIGPIQALIGPSWCRLVEGSGELWVGNRRIYLVGANDERAGDKIRGMTLAGAYVDEVTLMPESMYRMLGTRLSVRGAKLFVTTNPDNPRHWFKINYLDKAALWVTGSGELRRPAGDRLNLHRFSFRLADNPHLEAEYLAALEAEYTGLWRRRFILGDWVMAEGAIYDMWDEDVHVRDRKLIPAMNRLLAVGIDYGTRNPFAALLLGLAPDPLDGRNKLWMIDQWRYDSATEHGQMTSVQYSAAVRSWLAGTEPGLERRPEFIYVDPSAADFRQQLYNDGVSNVMAGDNAVVPGIRTVSGLLSAGLLLVSDRCTGWRDTAPGYAWDDKAAMMGEDKPIKVADHDLDAGRYAVESSAWQWRGHLALAA
jgi:PBSX family phage terminase large subunit